MNESAREELKARLASSISSYERFSGKFGPADGNAILENTYVAILYMLLGQVDEARRWFARLRGMTHALLAQDAALIRERAEEFSARGPEGKDSSLLAELVRAADARALERVAALRSAGLVPWFCDMGEAIVTGSSEAFAAGLNAWLTFHKRQTQRGRHSFNSPLGFLSIDACAFCTVAASRGIEVRVDKKFSPAKVQILFIMLEDLENPPSHIQVEFVPELYRVRPPWAGQI